MAEPARRFPASEDLEPLENDPFRFGWGFRKVRLPDGSFEVREVPLTAEDLLDPQVGDCLVQNGLHIDMVHTLFEMVKGRYESRLDVLVTSDMKMRWGIRGLSEPAPDLAVIPGILDLGRYRRSFHVRKEGTRPCLVVEVVSDDPEARHKDLVEKVPIYERAWVPEYLIVHPSYPGVPPHEPVIGYRLDAAGRYQPVEADAEGRVLSLTTGLWFGLSPDGRKVELGDAETGERLLTPLEAQKKAESRAALEAEARQAAERRAREAEKELAQLREKLGRLEKQAPPSKA
jgi:Uma2 family endonuclease